MSLKDAIKAVQQDLPVTMRHERWLAANHNPAYSDEALAFAARALEGTSGSSRLRKRMFRASSAGRCERQQLFKVTGVRGREDISASLSNVFLTGNYLHLKWQMAGLTEGWLVEAEVPVDRDDLNAGGTMDGILYTGGGFEFKSINSRGFGGVMLYGPKPDHVLQVHHYMHMGGLDSFSVLYENKDTGEWREFRVNRDEEVIERSRASLERLNGLLSARELPPMLEECVAQTGMGYRNCAFRDVCPGGWP